MQFRRQFASLRNKNNAKSGLAKSAKPPAFTESSHRAQRITT